MSQGNVKDIRKQIRNVAQEMLPEIMAAELKLALYKKLSDEIHLQLKQVTAYVKDTLDKIDERSKQIQTFSVNQSAPIVPPAIDKK